MSEHHYKFNIAMSCGGCSGAVERVLKKLDGEPFPHLTTTLPRFRPLPPFTPPPLLISKDQEPYWNPRIDLLPGVKSFDVSLETQTADVVAAENLDYETVLGTIKKTGKTVKSGEADGESRSVE